MTRENRLRIKRTKKAQRRKRVLEARENGTAELVSKTHQKLVRTCDPKTGKELSKQYVDVTTSKWVINA